MRSGNQGDDVSNDANVPQTSHRIPILLPLRSTVADAERRLQFLSHLLVADMDNDAPRPFLTTHVLDTSSGQPASGIKVSVYRIVGGNEPALLCETHCQDNGRATLIDRENDWRVGLYRLRFWTKEYFVARGKESFYPYCEITFEAKDPSRLHVPLILSPFGYSTYRGS